MKNQFLSIPIAFAMFLLISSFTSNSINSNSSTVSDWELLGSRKVNFGLDHDEIMVTAREGVFKSIQIRVKRSGINMHKLVVHFGDGSEQNVELRNEFRAGSASRIIDLEGNNRVIRRVSFWYDTKNYRNRKGVVELWGRK